MGDKNAVTLLQAALDSLPAHIALLNRDGTIIAVNAPWVAYAQENALDRKQFGVGDNYIDVCRPSSKEDPDARAVTVALEALLQQDSTQPYHRDYLCPHPKDPSRDRWFHLCMTPFFQDGEKCVLVSHEDITARHVAERSRSRLEQAFAQTRSAIMITKLNGDIEYVNDAFSEITGYSAFEAIGRNPRFLKSGKISDSTYAEMWRTILTGNPWHGQVCNRRKDGQLYWEEMTISPVKDPVGVVTHYIAVKEDVTEDRQREMLYAGVIRASKDAFIALDSVGSITDWSPQAEAIFGLSRSDVLGKEFITTLMAPELIADALHQFAQFKAGHGSRLIGHQHRTQMRRHDGQTLSVELWLAAIDLYGEVRFSGFIRELTEVVQREQELLVAQKMEAIGQMTGGLAHDFNNYLSMISGSLGLVVMTELPAKTEKFVQIALDSAKRASDVTKSLMTFARRGALHPVETDINLLLENLTPLIEHSAGKNIKVQMSPNARDAVATVDVSGFNNAILNLVINARDAMPKGGKLHLYSYSQTIAYSNALQSFSLPEGDYLVVGIDDSGEGMPPEVIARAFEPFFTTKESGKGTGLGLAMVYAFCRQSGGAAQIYSQKGIGTSIQLILPTVIANSTKELQS